MKVWILVIVAVALLIWSLARERFEPTSSIKAPPYDDKEKARIYSMLPSQSASTLLTKAKSELPNETNNAVLTAKAASYITPALESFFTTVYKPGTTTIRTSTVDTFMKDRTGPLANIERDAIVAYFLNQSSIATSGYLDALAELGQTGGYRTPGSGSTTNSAAAGGAAGARPGVGSMTGGTPPSPPVPPSMGGFAGDEVDPVCPAGTSLYTGGYGTPKCETPGVTDFTCPSGYVVTASRNCRNITNPSDTIPPQCPAGKEFNNDMGGCIKPMVEPTCPSGYQLFAGQGNKCRRTGSTSAASPSAPPATTTAPSTPPATTTGGTSTSTWGPTSGGPTSRLRQVFGPQFAGQGGDLSSQNEGDSSQTNVYPELLGGLIDSSSRIPGAGITAPSKNWTLTKNGSLPPKSSMGADELARYFPFSRTPGDMDIIPDPYRVAQTFSASSYASKTEPVPFLTDFSAFQK